MANTAATGTTRAVERYAGAVLLLAAMSLPPIAAQEPEAVRGEGFWHTDGNLIRDSSGEPIRIAGLSWFGLETYNFAPHGLWTRNYRDMMDQIRTLGYNTIRLPYSNQLFDPGSVPSAIDYAKNPELAGLNGLEIMDRIISYAGEIGLKIILDRHRASAGGQSALWYTEEYPESRWIADWVMLAQRYRDDATVIGADLHNEPHDEACWGCGAPERDWRLAAERAGNAILAVHPEWLIIVEGVQHADGTSYWWGGNLAGAGEAPVRLDLDGRLVYSAHDYPASIYPQSWLAGPSYPGNLPSVWDRHWGHLHKEGVAPVLVGEFGSRLNTDSDRLWFEALIDYIGRGAFHWTFWCWNPNSGDTGGILQDDWRTVDAAKHDQLAAILFPFDGDEPLRLPGSDPPEDPAPDDPDGPGTGPGADPQEPGAVSPACIAYNVVSQWDTGFVVEVALTNNTDQRWQSWDVTWTYAAGQTVRNAWNGVVAQEGNRVRAEPAEWNGVVEPGASVSFGFQGSHPGMNPAPADLLVNGNPPCGAPAAENGQELSELRCRVHYSSVSDWRTGFVGEVTIQNTGGEAVHGWVLEWQFPDNQTISNLWNGAVSQTGKRVAVRNAGWNATVSAGGSVAIGFQASYFGNNRPPSGFTLNGAACESTGR